MVKTLAKQVDLEIDETEVEANRILLLEDDVQLQDIIKNYLEGVLYDVVAVQNGVAGVKEILSSDFHFIICDLMMPKLAGDMFYMAVKKAKPVLANRFIFITGHRGNPAVTNLVKKVGAVVLEKPFQMNQVLEAIMLLENRPRLAN